MFDGRPACWDCFARTFTGNREVLAVYFNLKGCEFAAYCFDDIAKRWRYFVSVNPAESVIVDVDVFVARFVNDLR